MKEIVRIDRGQLAFVRAVIQGIPVEQAAQRFLGESLDKRGAQRELRLIRDELATCARRAGAWADAHALRIDAGRVCGKSQGGSHAQKTLEEFRAEVDPFGNYYSEQELLEVYMQRYPEHVSRYARRVQRLRERQLRALRAVEEVMGKAPLRNDAVACWFDASVSKCCLAVDIVVLSDLLALMRTRGRSWYKVVPGIGAARAARIQDWVLRNAPALTGQDWPRESFMSRQELQHAIETSPGKRIGIVPLERLEIPPALNGRHGSNRLAGVSLAFDDDLEAIEAWLREKGSGNAATLRQYRREAERLLLWALIERGKALSSLSEEDLRLYQAFLADPGERWINAERVFRASPRWKPFRSALSERNVEYAMRIVGGLFGWLTAAHYLARNICLGRPWDALRHTGVHDDAGGSSC